MESVYIADGLRTYTGLQNKIYGKIPAEALAAKIIKALSENASKKGLEPQLVIAGNATAGGGNIARLSLLLAGLQDTVAGFSIDAQCASGLESIISGYSRIKSGLNSTVIAGGAESASTKCIRSWNPSHPNYDSQRQSNVYSSAQFIPEDFSENSMIKGADETCRKYGITNQDMIPYVLQSHKNAAIARDCPFMKKIILPCFGATKDQGIRESISENLALRLNPVLKDGIITPATSCLFSDGAAFVTLTSSPSDFFGSGFTYKIKAAADTGASRFLSPESLIEVIKKLIASSGVNEKEISRIDYNQAFACMDILYKKNFTAPANELGGALAYGHPYGASGALITLHLLCAMEQKGEK